jgi:chromosome segregation ATPase
MSSDLNKRIADLEQELLEARETKYRLEDELNMFTGDSEAIAGLHEDLAKHEAVCQETQEKIQQLTEAKEEGVKLLEAAKAAAENIDSINEELTVANNTAESKQGALDEVMMSAHFLESKLSDLENSQALLQNEYSLAQANEEYVGGLQKKLDEAAENVEALNADLREATDRKYDCERSLFGALKQCQQLEMRLTKAQADAETIIPIEHKLMEIDEVLAEEQDKLNTNIEYVRQLQEDIAQQGTVNESQDAELEAVNTRIGDITVHLLEARMQLRDLMAEEAQPNQDMTSLLDLVDQCMQYNDVYNLEEAFNKVGMTIQRTTNDRNILCRCQNNKIVTENVIDDFIFIGPAKRLHEGVIDKIKSFVIANEGAACKPTHEVVTIMNEDKKLSLDFLVENETSPFGSLPPRTGEAPQSSNPVPNMACPRCNKPSLLSARSGYNCSACGWRGGSPLKT